MNRRETTKLETREKVLAAARALFSDPGYDQTTVRMIAQRAGVAVGSVFTTFDGKEDVLAAIIVEKYDELADALAQVVRETPGSARARLKAAFAAAYALEHQRHAMLMHQISASWVWSREFETRSQAGLVRPFGFVFALLEEARQSGELRDDAELPILADAVLGLYMRNWRHGWYRDLDVAGMAGLAAKQVDLLFDGAAPR
jgi:TetR/AcrR family transcriptional regulator, cholesterol catabolism regulator